MSQQGDSDRREEDDWWQQLYGPPARHGASDPPVPDSVDDHFAAVRTVMDGTDRPTREGNDGSGGGGQGPGAPAPGAPWEGKTEGDREGAGAGEAGKRPPGVPGAPGAPGSATPDTLRLRTVARQPGTSPPGQAPGNTTGAGEAAEAAEAAGNGQPEPDEPPAHVGDRPPTYGPDPTAWPAADPENLDFLTPDTVLDGARYGPLTVRAASVRGDSARYRGQPRRDALLSARFGEGESALLLIATASGVRAAEESHRAARDACRWIASSVGRHSERLADDIRMARRGTLKSGLHRLTDRCLGQLRLRACELGYEPDEYSAALRCLLLPVDPECRTRVFFGVGEGGLFRLRDGEWQDLDPHRDPEPGAPADPRVSEPQEGSGPRFRFRASVGHPGDVLLLCTEGMAEPLRGESALAELLAERWGASVPPPGLTAFLRDTQVRAKGYADDRTAVAAWEA